MVAFAVVLLLAVVGRHHDCDGALDQQERQQTRPGRSYDVEK